MIKYVPYMLGGFEREIRHDIEVANFEEKVSILNEMLVTKSGKAMKEGDDFRVVAAVPVGVFISLLLTIIFPQWAILIWIITLLFVIIVIFAFMSVRKIIKLRRFLIEEIEKE